VCVELPTQLLVTASWIFCKIVSFSFYKDLVRLWRTLARELLRNKIEFPETSTTITWFETMKTRSKACESDLAWITHGGRHSSDSVTIEIWLPGRLFQATGADPILIGAPQFT
jgi:hypothetical protein